MTENNMDDWGSAEKKDNYNARALPITPENKFIYQIGIGTLSITVIIALIGMIMLAWTGKDIPQALTAIGSIAIGALGGLFSQSR